MTSYHDLERQVYEDIRAMPFTRIHGRPTWRTKEKLMKEAKRPALNQRVSYDWAGQFGLLAEIIGAARYALDNPAMPAFVAPVQPANTPTYPNNNPTGAQIKAATDANNLEKRDWAVLLGFRRGSGENMRDALDMEFYSGLEHEDYGYLNILPREYLDHLEQEYCPLDVIAIDEVKNHALRGWERNANERLSKFATRIDQSQTRLAADGITITDEEKFRHYLSEVYSSGVFANDIITQWTERDRALQTYANARTFFEGKQRGMETVERLTGRTAGSGYSAAAAALELKELQSTLKTAITETVAAAIEENRTGEGSAATDSANAVNRLLTDFAAQKKEIADLSTTVMNLTKEIRAMRDAQRSGGSNKENESPTSSPPNKRRREPRVPKASDEVREWKDGLAFDKTWSHNKKNWYFSEFKKRDLAGWKVWRAEGLKQQLKALE